MRDLRSYKKHMGAKNLLGELHPDEQLAGVPRKLGVHIKEHVVDVMRSHLVQQQIVLTL